MPLSRELQIIFLGDEGAGKTTLLATFARYLALVGMPNEYYFEDLNAPRRRHVGGDSEKGRPWVGGADVRAVTAEFKGGGRVWRVTDLAGCDHLPYLAASPRRPDAAVITVNARTGLGREGIRQARACAILGIPDVIVYVNLFGQAPESRHVKTVAAETDILLQDYLGRWPVKTFIGNYLDAVREMALRPGGPFRSFLCPLAETLASLDPKEDESVRTEGTRIPCVLLNLEGTLNSVLSVPDQSRVTVRFHGSETSVPGVMELRSGPEESRRQKAFLRSGECSEAVVLLDAPLAWNGGDRFFIEYEDRLRITGIAARRAAFPPFA